MTPLLTSGKIEGDLLKTLISHWEQYQISTILWFSDLLPQIYQMFCLVIYNKMVSKSKFPSTWMHFYWFRVQPFAVGRTFVHTTDIRQLGETPEKHLLRLLFSITHLLAYIVSFVTLNYYQWHVPNYLLEPPGTGWILTEAQVLLRCGLLFRS